MKNKKKYVSASITRLNNQFVTVSKHSSNSVSYANSNKSMWYEQLNCEELTSKYGSPLFVVSEEEINNKINYMRKVFSFPGYEMIYLVFAKYF